MGEALMPRFYRQQYETYQSKSEYRGKIKEKYKHNGRHFADCF